MKILTYFALLCALICFGCNNYDEKKVAYDVCDCISNSEKPKDTNLVKYCLEKHAISLRLMFEYNSSEKFSKTIVDLVKSCPDFGKANIKSMPDDWQYIDTLKTNNNLDCSNIRDGKGFYYIGSPGDTTFVDVSDGIWTETIEKEFYSKLEISFDDSCSFTLRFLESDHPYKKLYSKVGEEYKYKIINKGNNYFDVATKVAGNNYKFKLFIDN